MPSPYSRISFGKDHTAVIWAMHHKEATTFVKLYQQHTMSSSGSKSSLMGLSCRDHLVMIWALLVRVSSFSAVSPSRTRPKFSEGSSTTTSGPWRGSKIWNVILLPCLVAESHTWNHVKWNPSSHPHCLFFLHLDVQFIHSWICSLLKAIPVCRVTHQETCICNDQWLMARIVSLTEEHQHEKKRGFFSKNSSQNPSHSYLQPWYHPRLLRVWLWTNCFWVASKCIRLMLSQSFLVSMRVLQYSDTHSNVWTLQCQIQPLKSLHKKRKAAINLYIHTHSKRFNTFTAPACNISGLKSAHIQCL